MNNLLPLPVLLPLLGAGLALVLGRQPRAQRAVSSIVLLAVVVVAAVLVFLTDQHGAIVLWVGAWPEPLGIALVADRLSALMLLVSSIVSFTVLVFSMGQDIEERKRETPISIFHPTFLVLSAGVSNAFLAGDLHLTANGISIYVAAKTAGKGGDAKQQAIADEVQRDINLFVRCAITHDVAAAGSANLLPTVDLNGHFIASRVTANVRMTEAAEQTLRELVSHGQAFELGDVQLVSRARKVPQPGGSLEATQRIQGRELWHHEQP